MLRLNDPRRFGAVLQTEGDPLSHPLLQYLGPEPLTDEFHEDYLFQRSRNRKQPIKLFLMDSKVVVGVGNIYANEALFKAGIRPSKPVGRMSKKAFSVLVKEVKSVLEKAIAQGGTSLKDFVGGDGKLGYFKQELLVYGRGGLACTVCGALLKETRLGQRATVYCGRCQK